MKKLNLQAGDKVYLTGDSYELWITDYPNIRVSSEATVMKTPKPNDRKVLLQIDYIDHETNVTAYVRRTKIHPVH